MEFTALLNGDYYGVGTVVLLQKSGQNAIFSVSGNIFKCLTWKKMHICLLRLVYERLA